MSGEFRPAAEVEVRFDFRADSGVIEYIEAKSWAQDRFGRDVRWRLLEAEGRGVFTFRTYPDALMFALFMPGASIRSVGGV
jgi:hypothetical protein